MLKIKLPFGFKTLQFDNLCVFYTGKIRIKINSDVLRNKLQYVDGLTFTECRGGCTIVSYITQEFGVHLTRMNAINTVLAEIMHNRIDVKYGLNQPSYVVTEFDELAF